MKTKAYVRFMNRAAHFDADIELVDVFDLAKRRRRLHKGDSPYLFEDINPSRHPRLAARTTSPVNRNIAVAHLKSTLYASFLKDLYEDLTQYLREILEGAAASGLNPNRLVGEQKVSFEANELLACGTWDAVVRLVSYAVFRKLENEKKTAELLQKMSDKLNLGVDATRIQAALPYLELRHLLVHADGVADPTFCAKFPGMTAVAGKKVALSHQLVCHARTAIYALVKEFDEKVVVHRALSSGELQP